MDRETVITHLIIIRTWAEFSREYDLHFITAKHLEDIAQWADDALNLLKEQEPREPHYTTLKYLVYGQEVKIRHPECPRCIENGLTLWDAEIEKGQAYCKRCGQKVKWV